ncbi:hypothetical protein GALL_304870 [mine drainage metagenome]|uniref:Uncharacterized protein n=1 Tax=mine drainage metagenome TaxID=410659 RepID=A0A1J5QVT7_9ZZZZ
MSHVSPSSWPQGQLDSLNTEVLDLLESLRNYIRDHQAADFQTLDVTARIALSRIRSALTLQLTSMAGWVLFHQAQAAGEDLPAEATAGEIASVLKDCDPALLAAMPEAFRAILHRADALFCRLSALDA